MSEKKGEKWTSIRGLDRELYKQARQAAIREDKPVGVWIGEAIAEKLKKNILKVSND